MVSPVDFSLQNSPYVSLTSTKGVFFLAVAPDQAVQPGTVAMGKDWRAWTFVRNQGDFVQVQRADIDRETGGKSYLASAVIDVSTRSATFAVSLAHPDYSCATSSTSTLPETRPTNPSMRNSSRQRCAGTTMETS